MVIYLNCEATKKLYKCLRGSHTNMQSMECSVVCVASSPGCALRTVRGRARACTSAKFCVVLRMKAVESQASFIRKAPAAYGCCEIRARQRDAIASCMRVVRRSKRQALHHGTEETTRAVLHWYTTPC